MNLRLLLITAIFLLGVAPAHASSIRFLENRPIDYDFLDLAAVPGDFGQGEFSFELWVRPDAGYPVGSTLRGTFDQLRNWSSADPEPYSSDGWWLAGNWLLDGHTRPRGYRPGDTREGTFSLQFYGGGRLRWMFADTGENMPRGMVHAVQAWPAESTPSLLDGQWHHVVAIRRWRAPEGATLELWIDGRLIAAREIPLRIDMRRYWNRLAHPEDPAELGGWSFGAEVMTAWRYTFTQYEDYKGGLDDVRFWGRALAPAEITRLAEGHRPANPQGALAHIRFDEGRGATAADSLGSGVSIMLHNPQPESWSPDNRPER